LNDPVYDAPQESESESVLSEGPIVYNYGHEPEYYKHNLYSKKTAPKSQVLYIERFKEALQIRGGRGMIGLMKQFKLFDTDQSGYLDKYEFKKAVDDYEVMVHPKDLDNLFNSFDADGNGQIIYNEFLEALAGPMNKYRLQIVERAFDKLDKDGEGYIDINDIFASYDPYRHPDIASGKADPEGVYNDFKDTFEVYHNILHDYDSSAKVSRDEFTNFYTYASSQIENDSTFYMMINGVWNLDNKNNYDEMPYAGSRQKVTKVDSHSQWLNDHHRRMFGGDDNIYQKGDSSWQTTHSAKFRTDIPAPTVSAGIPTWPIGASTSWEGGQMHEDQRMNQYEEEIGAYYNAPHHYTSGGNQY
jgi:calcyphosin